MKAEEERLLAAPARLEHPAASGFRRTGLDLVETLPVTGGRLVIDVSATENADSAGLEALLAIRRRAAGRGYGILLRGALPAFKSLLELTKLDRLFEIEPSATN